MDKLRNKAYSLGASNFGLSPKKDKRFYVIYDNKIIHFGAKNGHTFIDHHDKQKRKAWIARHSKIKNKDDQYVINLKKSPSYWSKNILW